MATIQDFNREGQAIWLDYLRRNFIESGELKQLIDKGLSGVTSNPTIFEKAIAGSNDYDADLRRLASEQKPLKEIYEYLVLEDISRTADLLRPVYDRLDGADGFVSIEVDPKLANDTDGMVDEARRYFAALHRPNVMVKIPATEAGFPAIQRLIGEGINVNVTLIFSIDQYKASAEAFIAGLEKLGEEGGEKKKDLKNMASIASFFVSRVDTLVDKKLEEKKKAGEKKTSELEGQIGIANAKLAYAEFKKIFSGERWERLRSKGARAQRVLWASTSTKNPNYPDTLYIDNLIGPETVNTVPPKTLDALFDHAKVSDSIESGVDKARRQMEELHSLGIDFTKATDELEEEGISKFSKSIESLIEKIGQKRERILNEPYREPQNLGRYESEVNSTLNSLSTDEVVRRIWKKDYTVWKSEPDEISNRLGWLDILEVMEEKVQELENFVDESRAAGYTQALVLGMGGSSLAPRTFAKTFGVAEGFLEVSVLDTIDPGAIISYAEGLDLAHTLFVVSSKSGKTIETLSLFKYFYTKVCETSGQENAGEKFVAITDAGTELEEIADELHFRHKFLNDPNIGGRYSALSFFGLVPAALIGTDLRRLLDQALTMASACESCVRIKDNPGAWLGGIIGGLANSGRNKLTIITSKSIASFSDWIEQLIAESTGKEGKGILPVVHEDPLGEPNDYGDDRIFVYLKEGRDTSIDAALSKLEASGQPVIRIPIHEPYEIGGQFFLWEFATAVAGRIIGINPFNQPNVESSKKIAREMVKSFTENGTFPPETPTASAGGISVFGGPSKEKSPSDSLISFIQSGGNKGSYISLQAYLQETPETDEGLMSIRGHLRDEFNLATTLGYGPRFLHSTGQLHKGDAGRGLFIQLTCDDPLDVPIPDEPGSSKSTLSFGALKIAEALGDRRALQEKKRRVIRLHFGKNNVGPALHELRENLSRLEPKPGEATGESSESPIRSKQ